MNPIDIRICTQRQPTGLAAALASIAAAKTPQALRFTQRAALLAEYSDRRLRDHRRPVTALRLSNDTSNYPDGHTQWRSLAAAGPGGL